MQTPRVGELIRLVREQRPELAIVDINQKLQTNQSLPEVVAEVERIMLSRAAASL